MVNKRVWNAVLGYSLKNDRRVSVCFRGKPFSITVIQVCAPITSAKEAEVEWFYDHLQDLLELTPKKCPFHHRGLERKTWRSSNTWSNRRVWLWSTKWSRAKANWVLPRERTGHSKQPLPTPQEITLNLDISIWSIPKWDWLYSLQPKLYIVSKNKTRSLLCLRSWTLYCKIQT